MKKAGFLLDRVFFIFELRRLRSGIGTIKT